MAVIEFVDRDVEAKRVDKKKKDPSKDQIKEAVFTTIRNYEPRANIIDCLVEDRIDLNAISITVAFEIVNDAEAIVLDVILERVR